MVEGEEVISFELCERMNKTLRGVFWLVGEGCGVHGGEGEE